MARIRVRLQDGRTGTIDRTEYDPSTMEILDTKLSDTSRQALEAAKPKEQGLLSTIIDSMASPTRFAGGALIQNPLLEATGGRFNLRDVPLIGNLLAMSDKELSGLSDPTAMGRAKKAVPKALKESVKAMSYPVAGQAAGVTGLLPKAAVYGTSGGMFSQAEEGADTESIVKGALTSAVAGPLLEKVFKVGKTAESTGKSLRESSRGIKLYDKRPSQVKAIQDTLNQYGFSGSTRNQYEKSEPVIKNIVKDITKILSKKADTKNTSTIKKMLTKLAKESTEYSEDIPLIKKYLTAYINKLDKFADGTKITPLQLFKYKQAMGKAASKTFGKPVLNSKEAAARAIWDNIDDLVTKIAPEVKNLTKTQSYLITAQNELGRQAQKTIGAPLLSNIINLNRPVSAATNKLGQALQSGGQTSNKLLEPLSQLIPALAPASSQVPSSIQQPQQQSLESTTQPMAAIPDTNIQSLQQPQQQQEQIPFPMLLEIVAHPQIDSNTKKLFLDLYKTQQSGGGALDANTRKKVGQLDQASTILNEFARRALEMGAEESAPMARLKGAGVTVGAPLGLVSPEARAFKDNRMGVRVLLARSLGEVGNLSEAEQKAALDMIPDISDSREEVIQKTQGLNQLIQLLRQSVMTAPSTTENPDLTILQNLGLF